MSNNIDNNSVYEAVRDALHESPDLKINYFDNHSHYEASINWDKCPESVRDALQSYFEYHIQTGGFLYAVLTNDLYSACGRADSTNRECLFDIVQFLYNEVPSMCYGSPKKVGEWLHHE